MSTLFQDLRYAVRTFVRAPGFTLVAILTLALGIGANTALFSVVNGVLLNPLPYSHPDRLVGIHESKPNFATGSISYPNFLDWHHDNHVFASMAVYRSFPFILTGLGDAERVSGELISSDLFKLLDVRPLVGRTFEPGEDAIGAAPVVLISEGLWQRKLDAAPDVIGRTLRLGDRGYTIVGIIPSTFTLSVGNLRPSDVYVPIGQWDNPFLKNRSAGLGIHGIGRLKPGVTLAQAQADMQTVTRNLARAWPAANKDVGAALIPLRQELVGQIQPVLLILLGAVGFVLLIACVNIGNLVLARSIGRSREFAVRAALGAGRGRLVRQLLTESVLLAAAGGAAGLLVAAWGTQAALTILPTALPRAHDIAIDGRVLAFAAAVSLLTGLLFGLIPAVRSSRPSLQDALRASTRGGGPGRHRAQSTLVVVEVALALVLLVGAGLMVRTLTQLWNVDPGFNPDHALGFTIGFDPSMAGASPAAVRANLREVHDRIASTPGVQAVSLSWGALPMNGDDEDLFWFAGEPKPTTSAGMKWAISYVVEPSYLRVMGIPLERGRFFSEHDDEHAPKVAVVDEVFAHTYFGDADPIGRRLNLEHVDAQVQIVGVVRHVKQWGLVDDDTQPLRAQLYLPFMQLPDSAITQAAAGTMVVVRTDGPVAGLLTSLQYSLRRMNSRQVLYGAETMNDVIAESLAGQRFAMIVLAVFAGLALLLAGLGIYGVIAYLVNQKRQEIGIRIALGAADADVLGLVLRDGVRMACAGVAAGLVAAVGLTHFMRSVLYGVSATDPLTFGVVAVFLVVVTLVACYVPARRATRVDPLRALRCD